jgi:hypothetical protein
MRLMESRLLNLVPLHELGISEFASIGGMSLTSNWDRVKGIEVDSYKLQCKLCSRVLRFVSPFYLRSEVRNLIATYRYSTQQD